MRRTLLLLLCFIAFSMSTGCAPVIIGGLFYQDGQRRKTRQNFTANFRSINLEREKNGLQPLDLCAEKYHFDRSWARKDPNCHERIKRYEAGEKSVFDKEVGQ